MRRSKRLRSALDAPPPPLASPRVRRAYQTSSPHLREGAHRVAVPGDGREHHRAAGRRGEAALAPGDREARREPLDVPLPRPGDRLVEVVTSKTSARSGGRSRRSWTGARRRRPARRGPCGAGREVGRHDGRTAAVERERRRQHAPMADRDEVGDARALLRAEQVDGVGAVGGAGAQSAWLRRGVRARVRRGRRRRGRSATGRSFVAGQFHDLTKNSSIWRTTSMKRSKSTGLVT